MNINKRKVIPALALVGLTLGAAGAHAAETKTVPFTRPDRGEHVPHPFTLRLENLTAQQQEALEDAQALRKEGRYAEAVSVIRDAGITLPEIKDPEQHKERKREFDALIESNDYEAFRRMVADTPMADIIDSQEKFDALVESHELREDGKFEEAREALEDAGIKPLRKMKHVRHTT